MWLLCKISHSHLNLPNLSNLSDLINNWSTYYFFFKDIEKVISKNPLIGLYIFVIF